MAERKIGVSIVVPLYNSEKILPELYERLTNVMTRQGYDYEFVMVNDDSPDGVWSVLESIAKSDQRLKAVALRKNVGYDCAVMAGLARAEREYVVTMDDDLQHAPEDVPVLVNAIEAGHDVVYADFVRMRESAVKRLGSRMNDYLARLIINKPRDIYLSSFKIFQREIAREICAYEGPFPYIDGLIFQVTSSIAKVPAEHHARVSGRSNHGIRESMRIVFSFCTTFSILPLRIATIVGVSVSSVACLAGLVIFVQKVFYGFEMDVEGWTSIMLTLLILGGVQLMALGVIGEYVGRSYMNINRKPQYVVRRTTSKGSGDGNRNK